MPNKTSYPVQGWFFNDSRPPFFETLKILAHNIAMIPTNSLALPLKTPLTWGWIEPLAAEGLVHMAFDEALLNWCRTSMATELVASPPPGWLNPTLPVALIRGYTWLKPTLSVGIHQSDHSIRQALSTMAEQGMKTLPIVRRPTGGRALLHDGDWSFALITNHPEILNTTLSHSYCWCITPIKQTLLSLGLPVDCDTEAHGSAYAAADLCFDTKTPYDLTSPDGQKLLGSAQCRRQGGLLQHGSLSGALLRSNPNWTSTTIADALKQTLRDYPSPELVSHGAISIDPYQYPGFCKAYQEALARGASQGQMILEMLSTTSGSHLEPASDFKI